MTASISDAVGIAGVIAVAIPGAAMADTVSGLGSTSRGQGRDRRDDKRPRRGHAQRRTAIEIGGRKAVLITLFIPGEGARGAETGELIYYRIYGLAGPDE